MDDPTRSEESGSLGIASMSEEELMRRKELNAKELHRRIFIWNARLAKVDVERLKTAGKASTSGTGVYAAGEDNEPVPGPSGQQGAHMTNVETSLSTPLSAARDQPRHARAQLRE